MLIQHCVDPGERIFVLEGLSVQGSKVDDHSSGGVLFVTKERSCSKRARRWDDPSCFQEFGQLAVNFGLVDRRLAVHPMSGRFLPRFQNDGMIGVPLR